MTDEEALAEARRRWGPTAAVEKDGRRVFVGLYGRGPFLDTRGVGDTWEDAFAYATNLDHRNQLVRTCIRASWQWRGNQLWFVLRCPRCPKPYERRMKIVQPYWEGSSAERAQAAEAIAIASLRKECPHLDEREPEFDRSGLYR